MPTLELSEETYQKIKDQLKKEEKIDLKTFEDMIGKIFFIRTVTYHFIGKVEGLMGPFLKLSQTVWVADSGRFTQAIKNGSLNEVEIMGDWQINVNSITDFGLWHHTIPKEQK